MKHNYVACTKYIYFLYKFCFEHNDEFLMNVLSINGLRKIVKILLL